MQFAALFCRNITHKHQHIRMPCHVCIEYCLRLFGTIEKYLRMCVCVSSKCKILLLLFIYFVLLLESACCRCLLCSPRAHLPIFALLLRCCWFSTFFPPVFSGCFCAFTIKHPLRYVPSPFAKIAVYKCKPFGFPPLRIYSSQFLLKQTGQITSHLDGGKKDSSGGDGGTNAILCIEMHPCSPRIRRSRITVCTHSFTFTLQHR